MFSLKCPISICVLVLLIGCDDGDGVSAVAPQNPAQQGVDDAGAPPPDDGVPDPERDGGVAPDADRTRPDAAGPRPDAAGPRPDAGPDDPPPLMGETIGEHVAHTCFNAGDDTPDALLDGLSPQLVRAINCVQPGTLSDLPDGNWQMLDPRRPALVDGRAVDDLMAATRELDDATLVIRWAYRDVALQHLFYLWTLKDCDYAVAPGQSNHQDGLAVDVDNYDTWRESLHMHGWEDNIPGDRPHFNYVRVPDLGLGPLSLVAFQALWNLNVPHRPLALNGEYDALTAQALSDTPLQGFPLSLCEDEGGRPSSVGQAAWNGCEIPPSLVEELGEQIAEVLNCAEPGALAPMSLCQGPGCVVVSGPPKPEWLGAEAHEAVLAASQRAGEPVPLAWGWRGPALGWFLYRARVRHDCGDPVPPADNPLTEGRAIRLAPDASRAVEDALLAEGFDYDDGFDVYRLQRAPDLTALSVYAFQRLWNANHPREQLPEDGRMGPATRSAIDRAPPTGFDEVPCSPGGPVAGPAPVECVPDCVNQTCPGTYEFCHASYGDCAEVPCEGDVDCGGLDTCDDPARGSNPEFYCDGGRCRRR